MTNSVRRIPKRTRAAMAAARARGWDGKLETWEKYASDTTPEGWPNPDGTLKLSGASLRDGVKVTAPGSAALKHSRSPRLAQLQPTRPRSTSPSQGSPSSQSWRSLKSVDIVSFNAGAEAFFVQWLKNKIRDSKEKAVSIGWLYSNAAFELDISIETVKRYLLKHTADLAEFYADGKTVTLRERLR